MRVRGQVGFKFRPKLGNRRKKKAARVPGAQIDQLVACPVCGNSMQLSDLLTFKCKACVQELTAEEALTIAERVGA